MLNQYDIKKMRSIRIKSIIMMIALAIACWRYPMISAVLQLPAMAVLFILVVAFGFAVFALIYSWIKLKH
ncbi:MAG: hypothetical protein P1U34_11155 [Coxiellaceae bacterium]|nr:hypothetical protein [Coxiellaceae bacterium]